MGPDPSTRRGVCVYKFESLWVAKKQATEEARRISSEAAEKVAIQKLNAELPKIIAEYLDLVKDSVSADDADAIAKAQDEGGQEL